MWGRNKWLKRTKLHHLPDLIPNGNLTLKVTINVTGNGEVLSASPDLLSQCQKQILEELGRLFFDKQFPDVKIECDGQTFDCHKAILAARSPVFMAMFQSNMKESETKTANR